MKPREFKHVEAGVWVQPIRKGYGMACCDCGLVHTLNFRVRHGRVQFQAFRDKGNTKYLRHKARIRVKVKPYTAKNAFKKAISK